MRDQVLIVEDDADIADLIRVNLTELNVDTEHEENGAKAADMILQGDYALVVLDLMLPELSGLDICRRVRERKPEQAILMLTAKNAEMDRVLGLEMGADDYMTKPFSVRELQARVKAQLRKAALLTSSRHTDIAEPQSRTVVGSLVINRATREVEHAGRACELTATEFELLSYLSRHPNQVFSRNQLLESVWGYQHSGYEHTVNSHINRLRAKIEQDAAQPKIIQTVWGVGYRFNPDGVGA